MLPGGEGLIPWVSFPRKVGLGRCATIMSQSKDKERGSLNQPLDLKTDLSTPLDGLPFGLLTFRPAVNP